MTKLSLLAPGLAFMLCACARLQLTPEAQRVALLSTPPADLPNGYTEIGTLTCSRGRNYRKPKTNIVQCQNELRNKAAEMGAAIVVITAQQLGTHSCDNCVSLIGTAYRRR